MKLREKRNERKLSQDELSRLIDIDEPMLSKFENYKCLPIPRTMELLLQALDCDLSDIYESQEITYAKKKKNKEQKYYKLTVNLPLTAKENIDKALGICGYTNKTYWVIRCYERLMEQSKILKKLKKEN